MHVFFSGIGGAGIGPLARIALSLGYTVSGSDMANSTYVENLKELGVTVYEGQDGAQIQKINQDAPIDWYVYASALKMSNPEHPELLFVERNSIKSSKRDAFLNHLLLESQMKLFAVAGTHGKTTTTAMCIWILKELDLNPSWSVGGKLSFGDMGYAQKDSAWFVYECDEFDRNFLSFSPNISVISGMAYDHHEIYPTLEDYNNAFATFIDQSDKTYIWPEDADKIYGKDTHPDTLTYPTIQANEISLLGAVNRADAAIAASAIIDSFGVEPDKVTEIINRFPGVSRRFEYITPNIVSDYAHTPEKIEGCLQLAKETGKDIVAIYEPLTDRRQHFIRGQYTSLFNDVEELYWVPAFQAREHPEFKSISPSEFIKDLDIKERAHATKLSQDLKSKITKHLHNGNLIVAMTGGGKNSLDDWLRREFT